MGKQKRRIPSPNKKNKNKVLQKNVEIAPNFKESSDNQFQDALAKKDFIKARNPDLINSAID